ncbi:hypothetical protein IGJ02_002198 [Enterococcus sp. DIV0724b]|uniref:LytR/AlgR family response regulator transcription factor n=1 Tax=Enterococcus sp. DIV0724b TaxID=2774694 RepID=UPI003D300C8A
MGLNVTVYVIEDDNGFRKKIIQSLNSYESNFLQFQISSLDNHLFFKESIQTIKILDTDIFIFDIDLKTNFTGIDLAMYIRRINTNCPIIFLTSLEDKAIDIINSNIFPLGYIVKEQRNSTAFNNSIHGLLTKVEQALFDDWKQNEDMVTVKNGNEKMYINCKELLYVESLKGFRGRLMLKTFTEDFIIDGRIGKLKELIKQPYMLTSLLSYIINLAAIASIDRKNGIITFSDGQELLVGTKIIDKIKKLL